MVVTKYNSNWDIQSYDYALAQYNVGGIIGSIRGQAVWPKNCLYTGELNATNGFTGPIFGTVRKNTGLGNRRNYQTQFNTLWQGNDAGNLTMESYYTAYSTNNRSFTATVVLELHHLVLPQILDGTLVLDMFKVLIKDYIRTTHRICYQISINMFQIIQRQLSYMHYNTDTKAFYFVPKLSATVEKDVTKYTIKIVNEIATASYTYVWY